MVKVQTKKPISFFDKYGTVHLVFILAPLFRRNNRPVTLIFTALIVIVFCLNLLLIHGYPNPGGCTVMSWGKKDEDVGTIAKRWNGVDSLQLDTPKERRKTAIFNRLMQSYLSRDKKNTTFPSESVENTKFHYLKKTNLTSCITPSGKTPFMLILVNSAVQHAEHRSVIRKMYASPHMKNRLHLAVYFLLGTTNNSFIDQESLSHNDIIQGDFEEDYHDMVRKVAMGIVWSIKYCNSTQYIMKTDDDMFLDIERIQESLWDRSSQSVKPKHTLVCSFFLRQQPQRNETLKWYVSHQQYPYTVFPQFCRGSFVIFTNDITQDLYVASQITQFIWLEDVFWWGLVSMKLKLFRFNWSRRGMYDSEHDEKPLGAKIYNSRKYWFAHMTSIKETLHLWNQIRIRRDIARLKYDVVTYQSFILDNNATRLSVTVPSK